MSLIEDRIWIDGCFDFFHHGHANAILQAKQLGSELYIGIHSDEEISRNKGPTVMNLKEREFTIDSNKWTTKTIINAPYVTQPEWMDKYQCKFVVHGDDITTDSDGNDCYGIVRDQGRLKLVKRTEGVSTTDLINRLLFPTDSHYIKDVEGVLEQNRALLKKFSSDVDGKTLYNNVWFVDQVGDQVGEVKSFLGGEQQNQSGYIYVEGSFDLFNPYHISVLKELKENNKDCKLLIGVYADGVEKTSMDLLQRTLCVLQCKYVDDVIIGVEPDLKLDGFNIKQSNKVHEGFNNEYEYLNHRGISKRIQQHYDLYVERQRKKGVKHELEKTMS